MAQKKKNKNNKKNKEIIETVDTSNSISKVIGTIIGVLIVFGIIYGLTIVVLNKGEKRAAVPEATISYQKILAGSSLNREDESYLVLFFSSDDDIYEAMAEYRSANRGTIYYVDLDDGLNKYVISDNTKLDVTSASELRVKNPTLIKVKKGKIVHSEVGKKNILGYFE